MGRRKKKETRQYRKRKPKEKELTELEKKLTLKIPELLEESPEEKPRVEYRLKQTPKKKSGVSDRLPLYMRENLPASALRLLDYYATFPQNESVLTSNENITDKTGVRSDTTIAAAEKALKLCKIIETSQARGPGGEVTGKYIVYLGVPDETPDIARNEFVKKLEKHLDELLESVTYFGKRILRTKELPDHKSEEERPKAVTEDLAIEDSEENSE